MNFIEELSWRGMIHDMTPGLEELMKSQKVTAYIGFDPTAPSLTIGNFVQIMLLKLLQKHGHTPIVLMGGATGRVGDPSGKDQERELKAYDELDNNLAFQREQFQQFLDFEGENAALVINNYHFYDEMNVLDFLRKVGKTLTVSYMMNKESVKRRLESGLSFTEFSYQLLQGYDFQQLFEKHQCVLQLGGSDQWGNITSGTEFIRRNLGEKAYALTTPLLTKSDGQKFGKSAEGNVWLSSELTSPYQFYQFWINADDAIVPKLLKYFSLQPLPTIEAWEAELKERPRWVKQQLAEELTRRVHSDEEFEAVQAVSELLFNRKVSEEMLRGLSLKVLRDVEREIPSYKVNASIYGQGLTVTDLLAEHTDITSSKSEARKAIKNNAVSLNKNKIKEWDHLLTDADWLHGEFLLLENGKQNKYLIRLIDE